MSFYLFIFLHFYFTVGLYLVNKNEFINKICLVHIKLVASLYRCHIPLKQHHDFVFGFEKNTNICCRF